MMLGRSAARVELARARRRRRRRIISSFLMMSHANATREELGENGLHDMAVDIGEAVVAPLEFVGEPLVIDAQEMKQGGLEVVNVNGVFCDVKADVIGLAVSDAWFDSSARHPDRESVGVVVTAPSWAVLKVALKKRSTAELASPDDEGVIEESPLFKVLNKPGRGLIGVAALVVKFGGE